MKRNNSNPIISEFYTLKDEESKKMYVKLIRTLGYSKEAAMLEKELSAKDKCELCKYAANGKCPIGVQLSGFCPKRKTNPDTMTFEGDKMKFTYAKNEGLFWLPFN